MLLYLITDRLGLGSEPEATDRLVDLVGDAAACGVDFVQIRERDLSTHAVTALVERAQQRVESSATELFVNDRFDVAIAARAAGVHLRARSIHPADVRAAAPGLRVGVSTHSIDEVRIADTSGADFVVFGPVFDTPSKRAFGSPFGLRSLRDASHACSAPVFAIGGIDRANASDAMAAGASGVAAIRMFQDAWLAGGRAGLASLVAELRASI